jgi:mono/diheme cytochrome c family protein
MPLRRLVSTGLIYAAVSATIFAAAQFDSRAQLADQLRSKLLSGAKAKDGKFSGRILALRRCAACHSLARKASPIPQAPNFAAINARRSRNQIKSFLLIPHGQMPRLDLSHREIDNVVAFIKSVNTKPPLGRSGEI